MTKQSTENFDNGTITYDITIVYTYHHVFVKPHGCKTPNVNPNLK